MPSCFVHTNFSARHGLLSTFNQRPRCTGNQCNHRLSASAASRVLKKKKIFKFLLFPPILLLWLTAYYYWQYFNVYVALRCGCGAVQVCFARGGSQRRARQHRSWRTLTSMRVLPSCVSRKQHVVYKTSHANVVLFTSCFGFVFLISRARNLQLWPCNIFQYQKTLCLISCLCVFKLLSLCACVRVCVRIEVGEGMVTASWFVGSHSSNWFAPLPSSHHCHHCSLTNMILISALFIVSTCYLSGFKINNLAMTSLWTVRM